MKKTIRGKVKSLLQKGNFVNIEPFMRNPVILWGHDLNQEPIGKALSLSQSGCFEIELDKEAKRYKETLEIIEKDLARWELGFFRKGPELLELQEISLVAKRGK